MKNFYGKKASSMNPDTDFVLNSIMGGLKIEQEFRQKKCGYGS